MIRYAINSRDILDMLIKKGYTTSVIRKEKLLSESTVQKLREGVMVDISSLGKICNMLGCQPDFLIENVITKEEKEIYKTRIKV